MSIAVVEIVVMLSQVVSSAFLKCIIRACYGFLCSSKERVNSFESKSRQRKVKFKKMPMRFE